MALPVVPRAAAPPRLPESHCTDYYDFFESDTAAHDFDRLHNPDNLVYGYCSLGWLAALLVVATLILVAVVCRPSTGAREEGRRAEGGAQAGPGARAQERVPAVGTSEWVVQWH